MAMESACVLRVGRDRYEGKVRMDGGYIDFAGSTKFRFRLAEIRKPRQEADLIYFDFHGTPVSIGLDERTATRWIGSILNPESLADKLGVKAGHTVRVMNLDDGDLVSSIENKRAKIVTSRPAECDMVMLGVERAAELRQIGDLSETLRPGGAIWVVLPKTTRTVTRANVITAVREAGLDNVKTFDYSETQAAYKVMRRKDGKASGNGSKRTAPKSAAAGKSHKASARNGGRHTAVKAK
ncbi:MAG: hypothetical protein ACE5F9_02685 [Phycisphaerae bacterium]